MDASISDLLNTKKQLSTRKIAKSMGISRKTANWHLCNGNFTKVDPLEVGSGKCDVSVWKNK